MKNIKSIAAILVTTFIAFPAQAISNEKLVYAVDLVRHGDRTPTCDIPHSPLHWQEGLGELTKQGKEQEILLGKYLHQSYINQNHLLPETLIPGTIYVRSTGVKRTIASAESILLGLYPIQNRPARYQEIPIHTLDVNNDNLLIANPGYNIFSNITLYLTNYKIWKAIKNNHQYNLSNWSEKTGLPLTNLYELDCLADNLHARIEHHVPLPDGINHQEAMKIISLAESAVLDEFNRHSFPMGKEFLKTVSNYMSDAIKNKNSLKYALFVGHDSTMMSVMHALKIPLQHPAYASRLNFSLYSKDNSYLVKVTFNGRPVHVSGCHRNVCSINQLEHLAYGTGTLVP